MAFGRLRVYGFRARGSHGSEWDQNVGTRFRVQGFNMYLKDHGG